MGPLQAKKEKLLDVVARFYEAANEEGAWRGVAADLAGVFDAPSAALHVRSRDEQVHLLDFTENLRITGERHRQEAAYWRTNDLWVARARQVIGTGRVMLGQELYSPEAFERTAFYHDWCRKQDQFHLVAALIRMDDGTSATFGIHRPRNSPPFTEEHRRLGAFVLEHFRRVLVQRSRLQLAQVERAASLQVLQRCSAGVLVVDEEGVLVHACAIGRAVLDAGDGLHLSAGRLGARSRTAMQALSRAVKHAAVCARLGAGVLPRGAGETNIVIPRRGRLPLTLSVSPLRSVGESVAFSGALVYLRDPEALDAQERALRELFGFTPAEAAMAARLAKGRSVEEAAREQSISINTARTHLRHVLAKTGTKRQAEAVALILQSVALVRRDGA